MSRNRYSARTDSNEKTIVKALRKLGLSVELGVNDIFVGYEGSNYWFEIKNPKHKSKKTGLINESAKKPSQKQLERSWQGHYRIVTSLADILNDMGLGRENEIAIALTEGVIK